VVAGTTGRKSWVAGYGGENAAGREENARSLVSRRRIAVELQNCRVRVDDVMRTLDCTTDISQ
jgi:hypothetical protein